MTTSHFAALAAALLFSTVAVSTQAAAADTPAAAPATQPAPQRAAKNDHSPNQMVCKQEDEIGTRLGGHKICHTRAEWDKIAHNGGDVVNAIQTISNHSNPSGN